MGRLLRTLQTPLLVTAAGVVVVLSQGYGTVAGVLWDCGVSPGPGKQRGEVDRREAEESPGAGAQRRPAEMIRRWLLG